MKTVDQQIASLDLVAKAAIKHVVNCVTILRSGDVVTLAAHEVAKPHEIVAASLNDKYDIWKNGRPVEFDVPLQRAVEVVVNDYKDHKIDLVMTHALGKHWKSREHKELLQIMTAEIYDDEKQREYSEQARLKNLP